MPEFKTDNLTLNYQQLGEGPDLVLVHGLGANLAFWYLGIASKLASQYRVLLYDLRGHGDSSMPSAGYTIPHMTEDLRQLLHHLKIERFHLVGHSFGARVALHYTTRYGSCAQTRVETLTIADTQLTCLQPRLRLADWPYWQIWQAQLRQQGMVDLPADEEIIDASLLTQLNKASGNPRRNGLKRAQRPSLKHRGMGKKGMARWETLLSQKGVEAELEDQTAIAVDRIRALDLPVLAVFGEYSHCLPTCYELQSLLHNCEISVIPEVGHFHPAIKPALFLRSLQQFLSDRLSRPVATASSGTARP